MTLDQVSEPGRGQRFAFIMDTRLCDAAFELADGADMVVCESTFADTEAGLAREYGHLTAGQAGRIAAESGARLLVLTHFSQRYAASDGGGGSPRKRRPRSAGRWCWLMIWTGSRCHPGVPQPDSRCRTDGRILDRARV